LLNMRVRLHRLGTPVGADPIVVPAGSTALRLQPQELPQVIMGADSDWALLTLGTASPQLRICVAPKRTALTSVSSWKCLAETSDEVFDQALRGSTLYLLSMKGTSHGRVLAVDLLHDPSLAKAEVVVEEGSAVLEAINAARDGLYVQQRDAGATSLLRLPWNSRKVEPCPMPFQGAMPALFAEPSVEGVTLALEGWTTPRRAFRYVPAKRAAQDLGLRGLSVEDYSDVVATETQAISRDGTHVPLTVLTRRDAPSDLSNLAILNGYGGYGVSLLPEFAPWRLEWVKAGHVFAVAHVRGGGENGSAWMSAGQGAKKPNGVDDFLACAGQLVAMKLTTPGRTAAWGASMGGVLLGNAMTRAPQAFGAVGIHAGELNPIRLMEEPDGANQIGELGDPRTEAGFKTLAAIDPYLQIRDGVAYPPTVLTVGLNDSRVAPWISAKFAARLRSANSRQAPTLIRTLGLEGHRAGSEGERAVEMADVFAFFESQLK